MSNSPHRLRKRRRIVNGRETFIYASDAEMALAQEIFGPAATPASAVRLTGLSRTTRGNHTTIDISRADPNHPANRGYE